MEKKEIEQALRDYHWMVRLLVAKRQEMDDDIGINLTARFGIDASLPKPQGNPTDPVYFEYLRRAEEWKEVEKIERKVRFIQTRVGCIKDEKEKVVLNMILDGKSLRDIAKKLGMSHTNVRAIRDSIVDQFYRFPKLPNGAKFPNRADLKKEKVTG